MSATARVWLVAVAIFVAAFAWAMSVHSGPDPTNGKGPDTSYHPRTRSDWYYQCYVAMNDGTVGPMSLNAHERAVVRSAPPRFRAACRRGATSERRHERLYGGM